MPLLKNGFLEKIETWHVGLSCQYTHFMSFSSKSEHDTVADQATLNARHTESIRRICMCIFRNIICLIHTFLVSSIIQEICFDCERELFRNRSNTQKWTYINHQQNTQRIIFYQYFLPVVFCVELVSFCELGETLLGSLSHLVPCWYWHWLIQQITNKQSNLQEQSE